MPIAAINQRDFYPLQRVTGLQLGLFGSFCKNDGGWWAGIIMIRLKPVGKFIDIFNEFCLI